MKKYFIDKGVEKKWLVKGKHFAIDKQKHVVGGLIVFLLVIAYNLLGVEVANDKLGRAIESGAAWVFPVAIAKEVWDFALFKLGKKPNWIPLPDIIATVALPLVIHLVYNFLIK